MFGVDSIELLLVAVLALIFIGPKELPTAMRAVGRWVGKIRGMARQFTSGFEEVVREAELEEMERKWREQNERIMREYPALLDADAGPAPQDIPEVSEAEDQPPLPLDEPRRELP